MKRWSAPRPGEQYGCWTVLGRAGYAGANRTYACQCQCGRTRRVYAAVLANRPGYCRGCEDDRGRGLVGRTINGKRILAIRRRPGLSRMSYRTECIECGARAWTHRGKAIPPCRCRR